MPKPTRANKSGGLSYYTRGHQAWVQDKDLPRAETLLREAIRANDNPEGATKNLASVLQQMGRPDAAIDLSPAYLPKARDSYSVANMLATIGAHAGQHELAVTYLEDQLPRTPPNKLCNIHNGLVYSHFKLGDYDKAEYHTRHVLKESPADVTAKGGPDTTFPAKQTGDYSALDTPLLLGGYPPGRYGDVERVRDVPP